MSDFGTLAWIDRTGGRLDLLDRLRLMAAGVRARAAAKRLPARLLADRRVEDILPPDSAIAREALTLCRDASPVFLFNHCLRAYFWARLLDREPGKIDSEALFVAMMLHDLGLAPRHRLDPLRDACFAATGAREAEALALRHGWSAPRARVTADAIALHLNVVVDHRHGPEARLVRLGSGADVAGFGLKLLSREQIAAVVRRYPRHGLKEELAALLHSEAGYHCGCRMAFLWRRFDFGRLVGQAPFDE